MNLQNLIAKGNTADIYLHDGRVIKLFKDFLSAKEAENEANKQIFAYSQGLPVPRVFEAKNICGKQAIIMEYVAGETIGDIISGDVTKTAEYMNLSVDVQLKIHDVKPSEFESMADKLERQLLGASLLSEKQKNALTEELYKMRYEKCLCHGDYHVFNLILGEKGVTIIDWVDSSAGDKKADACRTYLLYAHFSTELADMYLRIYSEKSGMRQDDILKWEPIIAGARLSENVAPEEATRLLEIVGRYCP